MGKKKNKKNRNKNKNRNNNNNLNNHENNNQTNSGDNFSNSENQNKNYVSIDDLNVNPEDYFTDEYVSDESLNNFEDESKNKKNKKSEENIIHFAEQIEKPQSPSKTTLTYGLAIFFALVITLLIASTTGIIKLPNAGEFFARNNNEDLEESELEISADDFSLLGEESEIETISESQNQELASMMTVRLPMLLSDSNGFDISGTQLDCDVVVWVEQNVPFSQAPLNATLNTLFSFDQELDFHVGNYVANQSNLSFDRATIENRVANVYLTGEVDPFEGVCDENRLVNQITKAATQFTTVDRVEIYLNGELY